ncbi:MAG: sulfide/dihydroorotate dehydrogenase-like FAD/NAD-binding protein [Deltaproteobacteria bacterium]|nr:sulfide/dihydroorotate dehydrogenase-like FAD/NAD-binding protein [Deltaproteobacteria bacterium]
MFPVLKSQWLAPKVRRLEIAAPRVAARHRPGHFVIVRPYAGGERIPLTIADSDATRGAITLVIQAIGASTERLCALQAGDSLPDVVGPLGKATEIENFGHVVLVGGGVGTAVIYPQAGALKAKGNRVTAVIGGRSREYVILEQELTTICDAVYPCTDDGSYGYKGFVTGKLAELIADPALPVNAVITAGPVPMMKNVAEVTRDKGILTIASLNPIMVDGTGMCGGCRVTVGGKNLFACVDGPEFNAHEVDFASLTDRLTAYRDHERVTWERLHGDQAHQCKLQAALAEATTK